jgi:glycosyltransferase involved in cell wall biosynthesis
MAKKARVPAMKSNRSVPLIGLVMVVKNELEVLPRCLLTAAPLIDTWTICDTGSTDDTPENVKSYTQIRPGRLYRHKWRSFGENLTMAHARARGTAQWLLWLHADMTVDFYDDFRKWLRHPRNMPDYFDVDVEDHGVHYRLPLLMRGDLEWRYVGPTHEYLEVEGRRGQTLNGLWVTHHADGSNREEKLQRDIELLKIGFRKRDPRAVFYTAEAHRYLGHDEQAALIYDIRAELNGWEEERWYAKYQAASLRKDVYALFELWQERPWRHEPLTAAGRIISEVNPDAGGDRLFLESVR